MIDLHCHSDQSDGTYSPKWLLQEAHRRGIRTLGITDHDTFTGYDMAISEAKRLGLQLVCGIELSAKLHGHSVHVLGYFRVGARMNDLRTWVVEMQESRRLRNATLLQRLQALGLEITMPEVRGVCNGMVGRPHFAQILVKKGYVATVQQAFDFYLAESTPGYVERVEPQFHEVIQRIRAASGVASLAHPVRIKEDLDLILPDLCGMGLNAIESYHSDHGSTETERYIELAQHHGLLLTGGSDFHGAAKPDIEMGTGRAGNLRIPEDLLERLELP